MMSDSQEPGFEGQQPMESDNQSESFEPTESTELSSLSSVSPVDETEVGDDCAVQFQRRTVEQIGVYQIVQEIGEGGMGSVYEAKQTKPVKRQVAIKVIKAGRDTRQVIARFEAERQALALMNHPAIAQIIDAGETDIGQPFFAMELIRGVPLTQYCDKNQLNIEKRLQLFCQICDGVQHAHQKGVVHRDLKPGNILVMERNGIPEPKIIDFGLAKALEEDKSLTDKSLNTEFGQVLGTIRYMSPEQAGLDDLDVDSRTDIYSLGVILYELLTGKTPIDRSSIQQNALVNVLEMVREKKTTRPSQRLQMDKQGLSTITAQRRIQPRRLSSILQGELDWVVMKSLEKDRDRRYASASEFADDIQRYLNEEPVRARPPSKSYVLRKFVGKNKGLVAATAAIFISLIAGMTGTTIGFVNADNARNDAIVQQERTQDVLDVVVSSFKNTNPERGGSRQMLATDVLANMQGVLDSSNLDPLGKSELFAAVVTSLLGLGENQAAEAAATSQLDLNRELFGEHSMQSIRAATDLAVAYGRNNKQDKALKLDNETFETAKSTLGTEHFETLRSMTNLGISLAADGQLAKATTLDEQALEIRKRVLGPEDPETVRSMNNLAVRYAKSDPPNWDKAVEIERNALEIRRREQGIDHPDTLTAMQNLARSLGRTKQMDEAIELLVEVCALRKQKLGDDHPQTQRSAASLAYFQLLSGEADAAENLEKILDEMLETLPADHPTVLTTRNLLANCYRRTGKSKNGILDVDLRRLTQLAQNEGINLPKSVSLANRLATQFKNSGQIEKARKINQIFKQVENLTSELISLPDQ